MSSFKPVQERLIRTLLMAAIGICLGALIATISIIASPKEEKTPVILNVAGVGGPWEMKDHNGTTRTDADFKDKYKLIYFGFTYCPAICPTELQKTAEAYVELPARLQNKIQMIFVTVDPERDTQTIMKNYVGMFHPTMIGLRGSAEQTNEIKNQYKVYAAKVPEGDSYTMDHSSFIYFMTPDDKLIALFKASQSAQEMEESIRSYMKKNG